MPSIETPRLRRYPATMSSQHRPVRAIGATALGLGMAALASGAAVHVAGRRVRRTTDPTIDPILAIATDVRHHQIEAADGASIHVVERTGPPVTDASSTSLGAATSSEPRQPVLLLHGVTLQWWVWAAQFNTLSDRYRVFAWDMRGHGGSTVGTDGLTMESIADDLVAVLERFDLHDTIVVGHSMGGMALGAFCAEHRKVQEDRVARLMFLATSAATMALPALAGGAVGLVNLITGSMADLLQPRLRPSWRDTDLSALLVRSVFGRHPTGKAIDDVRRMLSEMDPDAAREAGRAIATHDVRADLASVEVPTLVVVGDADRLTPPAHALLFEEAVPGAQLRVLPGIGHQVMQEDPEALARLIDELAAL
jgi:pimeloyl-ACP methyl ester carboxylesterase